MTFVSIAEILKKNLVIVGSSLVLIACLAAYAIRDGQIKRLEVELDDLMGRRSRMLKNFKYAANLSEDLVEMKSLLKEIESRLFRADDLAGNQRYFYQLETATQVKLRNLQQLLAESPSAKKDKQAAKKAAQSKYQEIVYEMNVNGSYENAIKFLRSLEEGAAFYRLDGLAIAPVGQTSESSGVSMRLGIQILGAKS